jgi:sialate O-acetylesterase
LSDLRSSGAIGLSARIVFCVLSFLLLAGFSQAARANIKLPSIMGDNMVLQRGQALKFWGLSDPGEYVTVIIGEGKFGTIADGKGRWMIKFPAQKEGPSEITIRGKNIITIRNVLWGDVWLCAGQANMLATVEQGVHPDEDLEKANMPDVRLFKIEPDCAKDAQFDSSQRGHWVVCSPETARTFSSVAFNFGQEVYDKTHQPLGLIMAARKGSTLQTWISSDAMLKSKEFKGLPAINDQNFELMEGITTELSQIDQQSDPDKYKQVSFKIEAFKANSQSPNCAFNAMISPIVPFSLKGVVWYQGENDLGEPLRLRRMIDLFMLDWRTQFMSPNLAFIYVQTPNILARTKEPEESQYADLREAQASVRKLPYAWVAVTIDTVPGANASPHPKDKREIAHRAALIALATQYHVQVKALSPFYDSMELTDDNKVKIHLRLAEPELQTKGKEPKGFAIAGEDKLFVWAQAEIDGDNVIVWSDKVKKPVAVRYAWADNPECNLYSQDNLPLCPFRTDTWPRKKKSAPGASSSPL